GIDSNVRLWPCAVGDSLKVEHLHIPAGLHGWASLVDFSAEMPDRTFRVQPTMQIPVDAIDSIDRSAVTFVKLDVERRELEALRGMVRFLNDARPLIILENVTPQIETLLASLEYAVFDFAGRPWRGDIKGLSNSVAVKRKIVPWLSDWLPARDQ